MDEDVTTIRARRDACTTFLLGDGHVTPAEALAAIDADTVPDSYGDGGVVAELEAHVAELLGKEDAVFLPSGTMAQGIMLRIHADTRTTRTVLWHPSCHLAHHELGGPERLHQLVARPVGAADSLLTLQDLEAVAEPVAALLLELPAREIGGQLPSWDDLVAQVGWARSRGAAVHCDGARLWQIAPFYNKPLAEIAELFDTLYVSFYKDIGALAGCCAVGTSTDMAQVREWRRRLGGTLYGLWPLAASGLARLRERLPELADRVAHARGIGAALADVEGVTVVPALPQAAMMHLLLRVTSDRFEANARRLAQEQRTWVWPQARSTLDPAVVRVELSVGRATCALTPEEVARLVGELLA